MRKTLITTAVAVAIGIAGQPAGAADDVHATGCRVGKIGKLAAWAECDDGRYRVRVRCQWQYGGPIYWVHGPWRTSGRSVAGCGAWDDVQVIELDHR